MVLMNLFAGQEQKLRLRDQTHDHSGGRRIWDKLRECHSKIYITTYKIHSKWKVAV